MPSDALRIPCLEILEPGTARSAPQHSTRSAKRCDGAHAHTEHTQCALSQCRAPEAPHAPVANGSGGRREQLIDRGEAPPRRPRWVQWGPDARPVRAQIIRRRRADPTSPVVTIASGAPIWPRPCWCQCRPAALARRSRGGWWRATARWRRRNVAFSYVPRMSAQSDRARHATQAVRACRSIGVAAHMWRHCCDRAGEEEAQRGLVVREPSISLRFEAARSTSCTFAAITLTCAFADVDG